MLRLKSDCKKLGDWDAELLQSLSWESVDIYASSNQTIYLIILFLKFFFLFSGGVDSVLPVRMTPEYHVIRNLSRISALPNTASMAIPKGNFEIWMSILDHRADCASGGQARR